MKGMGMNVNGWDNDPYMEYRRERSLVFCNKAAAILSFLLAVPSAISLGMGNLHLCVFFIFCIMMVVVCWVCASIWLS